MQPTKLLSLVLACVLATPALAIITSDSSVLTNKQFDYIIIGAGTAGLTLANRLSANPSVSVLVLEAGVSDAGVVPVQSPFLGPTVTPHTPWDWNYTTTAQPGLNGRSWPYPRGKLLGGSSSANYLFHQFGSSDDWNRLAQVTGEPNWQWSNMRQYVQKHEKLVPPVDGHDTTGQIIPALHGHNGTLPTSLYGFNQSIDPLVLQTLQQLPVDFPYNQDMSGGDQSLLGIGFVKSSAGGGKRSSSSTTYLAAASSRPNLTVLINVTVQKLLQSGTAPATSGDATITSAATVPVFKTVVFTGTPNMSTLTVPITITARKEVILSAGAIGTPQILQLSGIGNPSLLGSLNIPVLVNNPSVGANLSDHPLTPNLFTVQPNTSFDHILSDPVQVQAILNEYVANKTGLFANNIANNFGFKRLPANSPILAQFGDPAAGPGSPHFEMVISNLFFSPNVPAPATGSYMTIVLVLIAPTSRGTVAIQSTNPFTMPLINPNMLSTQIDIESAREGVRDVLQFVSAPAWANHITGRFGASFVNANDDASIDAYLRGITSTIFHPASTAMMTKPTDHWGVVNPNFRVKGVSGLRIVDLSVFPYQLSCHPQGPLYLMTERASEIIAAGL